MFIKCSAQTWSTASSDSKVKNPKPIWLKGGNISLQITYIITYNVHVLYRSRW